MPERFDTNDRVLPVWAAGAPQPQQPQPVNNANTARTPPNGFRPSAEARTAYAGNRPDSEDRTRTSAFNPGLSNQRQVGQLSQRGDREHVGLRHSHRHLASAIRILDRGGGAEGDEVPPGGAVAVYPVRAEGSVVSGLSWYEHKEQEARHRVVALDLGAGEGADAIRLAKLGYKVDAVEVSAVACEKIERFARSQGVRINVRNEPMETVDLSRKQLRPGTDEWLPALRQGQKPHAAPRIGCERRRRRTCGRGVQHRDAGPGRACGGAGISRCGRRGRGAFLPGLGRAPARVPTRSARALPSRFRAPRSQPHQADRHSQERARREDQ